jgi:hypothetical protein
MAHKSSGEILRLMREINCNVFVDSFAAPLMGQGPVSRKCLRHAVDGEVILQRLAHDLLDAMARERAVLARKLMALSEMGKHKASKAEGSLDNPFCDLVQMTTLLAGRLDGFEPVRISAHYADAYKLLGVHAGRASTKVGFEPERSFLNLLRGECESVVEGFASRKMVP